MIDLAALEKMGLEELRDYIVRRMRGDESDPPLAVTRGETPEDFLEVVHGQTANEEFRTRLEDAVVSAFRHFAGIPDLAAGVDADAVRYLAQLAQWRNLRAAVPMLLCLAERGLLGRGRREIDADAERAVLRALAKLQEPGILLHHWEYAWRSEDPNLWPVATAGLRRSAPEKALRLLREMVGRGKKASGFPLGEVLWAFRADPNVGPPKLSRALDLLDEGDRGLCREALRSVGASEREIEDLLPKAAQSNADAPNAPKWAQPKITMPSEPPRWGLKQNSMEAGS